MTLRDIWNNANYRFFFWLISALLAYRTVPDAGNPLVLSVFTGLVYLVMWVFLIDLNAGNGKKVSPLMCFMVALMVLMAVTYVTVQKGTSITFVALLWLVPVGMPLQGIVRVFSDAASRADDSMALVSFAVLAVLLVLRTIFFVVKTKKA